MTRPLNRSWIMVPPRPEIEPAHLRVGQQRPRRGAGPHLSRDEHQPVLNRPEAEAGVLLDHEDGDARLHDPRDRGEEEPGVARRQPGRGLVEGEQGRRGHEGGGHRHHLALPAAEMARERPEPVREFGKEVQHGIEPAGEAAGLPRRDEFEAELQVLAHAHVAEDVGPPAAHSRLRAGRAGAPEPRDILTEEPDASPRRTDEAVDDLHQRRLAGPVGTDDGEAAPVGHRRGRSRGGCCGCRSPPRCPDVQGAHAAPPR